MRRNYLIGLILVGALALGAPVLVRGGEDSLLAGLIKIVQEIMPEEETFEFGEEQEEFVNPQEVKQVLREIKDLKREGKRILKQLQKLAGTGDDVAQLNGILSQVADFESKINSAVDLRDNIQEFRDNMFWDEINKFRAKAEIPKEMKQWTNEIKRTERLLKQKTFQKLGLDLEKAKIKLEEMKTSLNAVKAYYDVGNLEDAIMEFDGLREDFHPGEINGVMYRMKDLRNMLKAVKDQELKAMIEEVLQEVIALFNDSDYRSAREVLDENYDELAKAINKAVSWRKKNQPVENFSEITDQLQEKIRQRAETQKELEMQKQDEQPTQSVEPQPAPEQTSQPQSTEPQP